jgi:major outer membrane protein
MQAKRFIPCATAALFSTTSLFSASPQSDLDNVGAKISRLSVETVEHTHGGRNPPTWPDNTPSRGVRLYASGDFLYWHASQDGLEYAVTSNIPPVIGGSMDDGHLKKPDFKWKPGFRLGLGYDIPRDQWDLYFTWTRLESEARDHADAPTGGSITPIWMPSALSGPLTSARSHWDLSYDVIDLELGREFYFTKALTGRPFLALRGVWISQQFDTDYDFSSVDADADIRQTFHAPALRAGLNMNWRFTDYLSMLTNVSGSLAYGKFNIHHDDDVPTGFATPVDLRSEFHSVKTNFEAALGLQWDAYFSNNRYHFAITAAYEFITWFNQNQLVNYYFVSPTGDTLVKPLKGDLSMQGLTLSARLDF